MAVFAPIPRAMMTMATQAKPGLLRNSLRANRIFCANRAISFLRCCIQFGNPSTTHQEQKELIINALSGRGRVWCSGPRSDVRNWTSAKRPSCEAFQVRVVREDLAYSALSNVLDGEPDKTNVLPA